MYDGNQVLRFESKYKSADLGGLGVELTKRKGTGNYDPERTIFNYSYVSLSKPTLQEQVYSKLKDNKIYYNDGKNTNLLNGAIVTNGKDFFQSLGMKFKASSRTYQVGKDKGKPILVPDINSNEDIPEKVKVFFNDSYNFLENLVGKDNVFYAKIQDDYNKYITEKGYNLFRGNIGDTKIYEQEQTISKQKTIIREKILLLKN